MKVDANQFNVQAINTGIRDNIAHTKVSRVSGMKYTMSTTVADKPFSLEFLFLDDYLLVKEMYNHIAYTYLIGVSMSDFAGLHLDQLDEDMIQVLTELTIPVDHEDVPGIHTFDYHTMMSQVAYLFSEDKSFKSLKPVQSKLLSKLSQDEDMTLVKYHHVLKDVLKRSNLKILEQQLNQLLICGTILSNPYQLVINSLQALYMELDSKGLLPGLLDPWQQVAN